ncbi:kinase-like protein [Wilcoxina mikolae CBS 423.85]|nr:kinase-like protein [Wilcoxina mikolae CBS 423.85]
MTDYNPISELKRTRSLSPGPEDRSLATTLPSALTPSVPPLSRISKLNRSIVENFVKNLDKDPSTDLQKLFQRYADTYPARRAKMIAKSQAEAENAFNITREPDDKTVQPAPTTDTDSGRLISSVVYRDPTKPSLSFNQKCYLRQLVGTTITATRPLAPEVCSLMDITQSERILSPDAVQRLSLLLINATPLFTQGRIIVLVSPTIVAKIGNDLALSEASLLDFIHRSAPDIPVPASLGTLSAPAKSIMFFSYVPGKVLSSVWHSLSVSEKTRIQNQLQSILLTLRQIPHNDEPLGWSGSVKDRRRELRETSGVTAEAEFNDFLVSTPLPRIGGLYQALMRSKLKDDHRVVITHGDLHPRNIIVDKNGEEIKITGIVDWEYGGWYPEHWEYLKALNTISTLAEDEERSLIEWWKYLPECLSGYDKEWAVDLVMARMIGS